MFYPESIIVDRDTLEGAIRSHLRSARNNGHLKFSNESFSMYNGSVLEEWRDSRVASKYLLALPKHTQHIIDKALSSVFAGTARYQDQEFTAHGLVSQVDIWRVLDRAQAYFYIDDELKHWLEDNGTFAGLDWTSRLYENYRDGRNADVLSSGKSLLAHAWARAQYLCLDKQDIELERLRFEDPERVGERKNDGRLVIDSYGMRALFAFVSGLKSVRPSRAEVISARNDILRFAQNQLDVKGAERREQSTVNFANYWDTLKARVNVIADSDEIRSSFNEIPLLPAGTRSSRSWGIEVETVTANVTSRPPGWDERGDGSLEALSDCCECGCDDCEDGSHCGYSDCADSDYGCAEFVSPILTHFNSAGLRSICDDHENQSTNQSPGIHIHVGANDLTAADIARLNVAYSAVSPLLWHLTKREYKGYCKDVSSRNLAFWLSQSRDLTKRNLLNKSKPIYIQESQPDDRYHDLNLKSLSAHGTIEFRAMGPVYDYAHLVRWAWLCREMVNVSKIALPQSTWTSVKSMADVIKILRTYGSEQLPAEAKKLYAKGDNLDVELGDEELND